MGRLEQRNPSHTVARTSVPIVARRRLDLQTPDSWHRVGVSPPRWMLNHLALELRLQPSRDTE